MAVQSYNLAFDGYWRYANRSGLPAESGIYCVYAGTYNEATGTVSLNRLLYIGESDSVRERVANHGSEPKWREKLRSGEQLYFSAAPISPMGARQRAEAAMIYHHKPPCNLEYVTNFPFDTTTISTSGKNAALDDRFTVYRSNTATANLFGGGLFGR